MARNWERYAGALMTRTQWLDAGAHSRDLAGPDFTKVFPGFHMLSDHPASLEAMAWVLQNKVLPGSVISHTTAALLWDIPLPLKLENKVALRRVDESGGRRHSPLPPVSAGTSLRTGAELPVIHARVAQGEGSSSVRGATIHRWEPGPSMERDKLVVSSPAEVLRELATLLPPWDLVAAADAVVAGKTECPPTTAADLAVHVSRMRGRRGNARLAAVLPDVRGRSWSPGESLTRLLLLGAGFPEPELNLPVQERRSDRTRYLDLAWPDAMCVLEYDGDDHRRAKKQWREDEQRRDAIAALGWTIIRANGEDLWHPRRILLRLADELGGRGLVVPDESRIRRFIDELARKRPSGRIAAQQPTS
ncbi:hypothetical protein [Brachybacterium massiliense]|uniref:hypothetical protein n=1 Tax=Brachybacterium massiliense TaxID=1755098 RepID=UPI00111CF50A|nr:hypothetical protein [Brachybacterium massiliense]